MSDNLRIRSRIIVTPDVCYVSPELEQRKIWGLSTNLYALNSKHNWGVGDFADLQQIIRWLSRAHGSLVGINPSGNFRAHIDELRKKELIDYEAVATVKEKILRKAFNVFFKKHYPGKTKRGREFQGYVSDEGPALDSFALFMALRKYMIKIMKGKKSFINMSSGSLIVN